MSAGGIAFVEQQLDDINSETVGSGDSESGSDSTDDDSNDSDSQVVSEPGFDSNIPLNQTERGQSPPLTTFHAAANEKPLYKRLTIKLLPPRVADEVTQDHPGYVMPDILEEEEVGEENPTDDEPLGSASVNTPGEIFCICEGPEEGEMIQCDGPGCGQWVRTAVHITS